MQILSNPTYALNVHKSPKFLHLRENQGEGTQWCHQTLDQKWKYGSFVHAQGKICTITVTYR